MELGEKRNQFLDTLKTNHLAKFSRFKKFFKNKPETENLVIHIDTFLNDIKEFEKQALLAMNLRVERIEKRHFETLSKIFKMEIDP